MTNILMGIAGRLDEIVLHALTGQRGAHLPIPSYSHGMPCRRRTISLRPSAS